MGRKIPGKKHRGVKDPIKQQANRFSAIKKKINAPPSNPDDQHVPRSVKSLIQFKEKLKNGEIQLKKRRNKKKKRNFDDGRSSNEVARMKKNPGESSRSFMLRINHAVQGINDHKTQLEQFKMGSDSDDDVPMTSKKRKFKLDNEFATGKKKSKLDVEGNPKLSRAKKWTLRKQMKKQKKIEDSESNFAPKVDFVRFGEVVHEPPTFTAKPRKAQKTDGAPRPGCKDLLLNKLLGSQQKSITVEKSGKRKDLPTVLRHHLEQSQQEAIDAYRALKNSKERL